MADVGAGWPRMSTGLADNEHWIGATEGLVKWLMMWRWQLGVVYCSRPTRC